MDVIVKAAEGTSQNPRRTEDGRLVYRVEKADEGLTVGRLLKLRMGLTEHQIRRAKFRSGGILCDGAQVRVTCKPGADSLLSVLIADKSDEIRTQAAVDAVQKAAAEKITIEGESALKDTAKENQGNTVEGKRFGPALRILYEDADLLAVDKPAGMAVHRGRGHYGDTLADAVCRYLSVTEAGIHIVGRLDRDTSGIVVFAKNAVAAQRLSEQPRSVHYKRYLAVVRGCPGKEGLGEPEKLQESIGNGEWYKICLPIRRQPGQLNRMEACSEDSGWRMIGRSQQKSGSGDIEVSLRKKTQDSAGGWQRAETHIRILESWEVCGEIVSLIEAVPITGRTHQIRVHMAALGHPLIGDPLYDREQIPRQGFAAADARIGNLQNDPGCMYLRCTEAHLLHPFSGKQLTLWAGNCLLTRT